MSADTKAPPEDPQPPDRAEILSTFLASRCPDAPLGACKEWADQLREYALILQRAAAQLSLVSQGDRPFVIRRHIMPALRLRAALCAVPHRRVLDLGSGAGLPGIPLSITLPEAEFFLVESRRRRANFLRQVVRQLQLRHTHIIHARLEDWPGASERMDVIVFRGVRPGSQLVSHMSRCLASHGALLTTVGPQQSTVPLARQLVRYHLRHGDEGVRLALWHA